MGIWPAFWSLGSAFRGNYTNWPMATEWDILESANGLPRLFNTIHCGYAPGGPCHEYNGLGNSTGMSRGEWHVIGFEVNLCADNWVEQTITWYLDGQVSFVVDGETVGDHGVWRVLTTAEHFLILNVAVGGTYTDALANGTGSTPTSATIGGVAAAMEVDYVGVWNSV